MIVAGIEVVWQGHVAPMQKTPLVLGKRYDDSISLSKGDEMGRFKLGSTVILLFGKDAVEWQSTLTAGSPVTLGSAIGRIKQSTTE